jgi:putative endonuclease
MARTWLAWLQAVWKRGARRWQADQGQVATLGGQGERLACQYLRRQRYTIVAQGLRTRWGEIDIVAVEGRTVVFVEVKTRRHDPEGRMAEVVDRVKQQRMTQGALVYLKQNRLLDYSCRFDVITILWPRHAAPELKHYRHAFEAETDRWSLF